MTQARVRYRISTHIDPPVIRGLAESSPRLRSFIRTVGEHARQGDHRARALFDFVARRILDDVGDLHLNDVFDRLDRIETLRDNIAAILDHVLDGGELPPGVRAETFAQYFDELQKQMRELTQPRERLLGDEPLRWERDSASYAQSLLNDFRQQEGGPARGAQLGLADDLRVRFNRLAPDRQAAIRRAAEIDTGELWRATVAASHGPLRPAAVAALRERFGGRLSNSEMASLEAALRDIALSGTPERPGAQIRAERMLAEIQADTPLGTLHAGPAQAAGAHHEPVNHMRARFAELPSDQKAAFRRAAELEAADLWQTIASENHPSQLAALAGLRERLAGRMPDAELARLEIAIGEISKARTGGRTGAAARGGAFIAAIADAGLRRAVEADPWILQEIRGLEPDGRAQLQALWDAYPHKDTPTGFRGYVRHEMTTYVRSVFGEHTAAGAVPEMAFFLKGPDIHTRRPGTDLVAVGTDGWIWIFDDKSHRAASVSSVSALFENLVTNLRQDARQFREQTARLRSEVRQLDLDIHARGAIERLQLAADEIDAHLKSLPADQRFQSASLARISAILQRHEIKLRVTSAFGEVSAISADLARIGIRVTPTGPRVPLP